MGRKGLLGLLLGLLAGGCLDQPDCFQLNNNLIYVSFTTMNGTADAVPVISLKPDGTDSVFYPYTLTTGFALPLNPNQDFVTYQFDGFYNDGTITLNYGREFQFVTEECGSRIIYSKLLATQTGFDSIEVISSVPYSVSETGRTNVVIRRCPRTNYAGIKFSQLINEVVKSDTVTITSITSTAGSPIFYAQSEVTSLNVPLDPDSNQTSITFDLGFGTKVLQLVYDREFKTLYKKCGASVLFKNLSVASSDFGQTILLKDSLEDKPVTNLEIYQ